MYGLLEAAEQIRATGRFAKVHRQRAAASFAASTSDSDADLEHAPGEFWHAYFQMLARNRFNRVHIVFQRIGRAVSASAFVSRAAADYGIDFTLGVAGEIGPEEMAGP